MGVTSPYSGAVMGRYKDAYCVANSIDAAGMTIKVVGFILAGIIIVAALIIGENLDAFGAAFIIGVIVAGSVGKLFWMAGVLVSSQGQLLLATPDSAVSHSPFLSDDEKANVMSLPGSATLSEPNRPAAAAPMPAVDPSGAGAKHQPHIQPGERTITCPGCGVVNPAKSHYCENCGRNLHI